uniref:Uncharacterized protein n=1 Tax=Setaria digitata TaxID=48799 RepID=A0A915Q7J1_9BILA
MNKIAENDVTVTVVEWSKCAQLRKDSHERLITISVISIGAVQGTGCGVRDARCGCGVRGWEMGRGGREETERQVGREENI